MLFVEILGSGSLLVKALQQDERNEVVCAQREFLFAQTKKWLKDRKGRTLNYADTAHHSRIVGALAETITLMEKVDEVIEEHGGWPLA